VSISLCFELLRVISAVKADVQGGRSVVGACVAQALRVARVGPRTARALIAQNLTRRGSDQRFALAILAYADLTAGTWFARLA
jgi:hypothetical protein